MVRIDLTGQRFGRLVVEAFAGRKRRGAWLWVCRCDCKPRKVVEVVTASLTTGHTKSCGCLSRPIPCADCGVEPRKGIQMWRRGQCISCAKKERYRNDPREREAARRRAKLRNDRRRTDQRVKESISAAARRYERSSAGRKRRKEYEKLYYSTTRAKRLRSERIRRNRPLFTARTRAWRQGNPEKVAAWRKRWRDTEAGKAWQKKASVRRQHKYQCNGEYRAAVLRYQSEAQKRRVAHASDSYVRRLLRLPAECCPQSFVQLNRVRLLTHRAIKEKQQ